MKSREISECHVANFLIVLFWLVCEEAVNGAFVEWSASRTFKQIKQRMALISHLTYSILMPLCMKNCVSVVVRLYV